MSVSLVSEHVPRLLRGGLSEYVTKTPALQIRHTTVLYIDIIGFSRFEQNYGSLVSEDIVLLLEEALLIVGSEGEFPWLNLQTLHVWDDGFAVVFPTVITMAECSSLIHRFVTSVEQLLNVYGSVRDYSALRLRYGLSSTGQDLIDPVARLHHQVTEAGRIARRHSDFLPLNLVEEMQHIVTTQDVRIHYQPIKHLRDGHTVGLECLTRGPQGSELESPVKLFDYAERIGCLFEMEQICRTHAIRHAQIKDKMKLFINISPKILSDRSFREGETRKVLEERGLEPHQIVFEITEHHAIKEYSSFLKIIEHYRHQGYKIAIDDVGAGHSGLVTLMQVKPDFVKIDMELIRGIERDLTRQDIVQAICQISRGFHATTIAEGVETESELECMLSCGVDYGQGYLFGHPMPMSEITV